jgi:ubiquinone/menaquinone biosynthesis C-methylase UbiE
MTHQTGMTNCPCCAEELTAPFYFVGPVPVHSCLMLDTAKEAAEFPAGDVRLALCETCGFVTNTDFDPKWSAYAPNYEDQQSFSPTFNSFAGRMATDLIARYALEGKKVVEIGCSKGDFLRLLCEGGKMEAVGIDPSALPGRVPPPENGTLEFIADYYGPEHYELPADLICCRHTLEHIQNVDEMLRAFRDHAAANPGCVVVIEVPDAMRVWEQAAFEDIYYEHCSYFSAGSLARAMRRAGFAVTDLRREYDDQYLVIEAVLDPSKDTHFAIEEEPKCVTEVIGGLPAIMDAKIQAWRSFLERQSEALAIWGSGSKCVAFLRTLNTTKGVDAIIDINPHRKNRFAPASSQPINTPDRLIDVKPAKVILMNAIYEREIAADLRRWG